MARGSWLVARPGHVTEQRVVGQGEQSVKSLGAHYCGTNAWSLRTLSPEPVQSITEYRGTDNVLRCRYPLAG